MQDSSENLPVKHQDRDHYPLSDVRVVVTRLLHVITHTVMLLFPHFPDSLLCTPETNGWFLMQLKEARHASRIIVCFFVQFSCTFFLHSFVADLSGITELISHCCFLDLNSGKQLRFVTMLTGFIHDFEILISPSWPWFTSNLSINLQSLESLAHDTPYKINHPYMDSADFV